MKLNGNNGSRRKLLEELYEKCERGKLDPRKIKLDDGTVIEDLHVVAGDYPAKCYGTIEAVVNGQKLVYPYRFEECLGCGACDDSNRR